MDSYAAVEINPASAEKCYTGMLDSCRWLWACDTCSLFRDEDGEEAPVPCGKRCPQCLAATSRKEAIRAAIELERDKGEEAASRAQDQIDRAHSIGSLLFAGRKQHKVTLRQLSATTGVPASTISRFEHDEINLDEVEKITAERDQLRKELADINTMRQEVLAGSCDPQNLQQHCNCVPWLREEIARLRNRTHEIQAEESKRNADLQSQVHKWEHYNRQAWERIGAERPFASRMEIAALLEDRDQLRAALRECKGALEGAQVLIDCAYELEERD